MKRFAGLLVLTMFACADDVSTSAHEVGVHEACVSDDDCKSGAECENVRCRDDGTCWHGTPTGFSCGVHGMCVEKLCIEVE